MKKKGRRSNRKLIAFILLIVVVFLVFKAVGGDINGFSVKNPSANLDWNLVLVNNEYKVPNDWESDLLELSNGEKVDSRIYPQLQKMFDDARSQGVYPTVASGYRTALEQREIMSKKVFYYVDKGFSHSEAKKEARRWASKAGYSEHQTGLAVDINADGVNSTGKEVYKWLADNAWKYGFILRYPENKIELTGIDYEPWHYRYVGIEDAEKIYKSDMCLEEYIDSIKK